MTRNDNQWHQTDQGVTLRNIGQVTEFSQWDYEGRINLVWKVYPSWRHLWNVRKWREAVLTAIRYVFRIELLISNNESFKFDSSSVRYQEIPTNPNTQFWSEMTKYEFNVMLQIREDCSTNHQIGKWNLDKKFLGSTVETIFKYQRSKIHFSNFLNLSIHLRNMWSWFRSLNCWQSQSQFFVKWLEIWNEMDL
jgi:hypothetical protein